jgi:putative protein kinase ArgK-like GTPase of G3E family
VQEASCTLWCCGSDQRHLHKRRWRVLDQAQSSSSVSVTHKKVEKRNISWLWQWAYRCCRDRRLPSRCRPWGISVNLLTLTNLHHKFNTDLLLIESGGDNLAANYSRELADFIIYIIDVSGGDKIPRKGGPGITQSDLLIVNKIDLAEAVGADLNVMERDSRRMREGGPTIFAVVKKDQGVDAIVDLILSAWKASGATQARKSKFEPTLMDDNEEGKERSYSMTWKDLLW